jgi:hypothetical protein
VALTLQQGWDFAIPMSPHCSAIFLQHSRSADVIAAPGNTQAATGSAANMSARAKIPILLNSFNITSLVPLTVRRNRRKKVSFTPVTQFGQPKLPGAWPNGRCGQHAGPLGTEDELFVQKGSACWLFLVQLFSTPLATAERLRELSD